MKQPNFFIVGAPKCGTTSLASWLSEHPQIFMSRIKEPHYFNTDMNNRSFTDFNSYINLFERAESTHDRVGEASTWYLYSRDAIPNISMTFPGAQLIVCIRNPIDMAISLFNQLRLVLNEDCATFEEAWEAQSAREVGRRVPKTCIDSRLLLYGQVCRLGAQIERLLQSAPKENIHFVVLDDLRRNPALEYDKTLSFLRLQPHNRERFDVKNTARKNKYIAVREMLWLVNRLKKRLKLPALGTGIMGALNEMNEVESGKEMPGAEFVENVLRPYFREDVMLLSRLLNRDFPEWGF